MANLLQRIRKLESRLTHDSALVPHSEEWFVHWVNVYSEWAEALDRSESTGETPPVFPEGITLAVIDRIIERADRADGLIP